MRNICFYHFYPSTHHAEFNLRTLLSAASNDPDRTYYVNIVSQPSFSLPRLDNVIYLQYENKDADFGGLSRFVEEVYLSDCHEDLFVANSLVAGTLSTQLQRCYPARPDICISH